MAHGSPRTPTTQGLVERSNRLWKEDMRALIMSTSSKNLKKWCKKAQEAAYTRNISYHRAIKMTLYEAVYSIKAHREVIHPDPDPDRDEESEECEEERPTK